MAEPCAPPSPFAIIAEEEEGERSDCIAVLEPREAACDEARDLPIAKAFEGMPSCIVVGEWRYFGEMDDKGIGFRKIISGG